MASRLRLAIGAEDMHFLMREGTTAAWEQLRLSQISLVAAFHEPLDEFGAISPAARLCFSSSFATTPIRSIRFFAGAVQNRAYGLDGITL